VGDLPRIRVVSAEICRDGAWLITQRRPDAVLPLMWEFPGGRVREGESDAAALARALGDRVGVEVAVHEQTMEVVHAYETYELTMAVYRCSLAAGEEPTARRVHDIAWATPEAFARYTFPGADRHTVAQLVGDLED
jgi:8-oxo-dGTP diphosphatase